MELEDDVNSHKLEKSLVHNFDYSRSERSESKSMDFNLRYDISLTT